MLLRPPRREEVEAVLEVIVARDVADIGRPDYTMRDLLADWALPELDFERDHFVVEDDDGRLIGWADVDASGTRLAVHPDHDGCGVGTLLREASEARMREMGIALRQVVNPTNVAAVEHLRAAGYERIQVYLRLRGAVDAAPAPLAVPVRRLDLEAEGREVHALVDAAFSEIDNNVPQSYETWYAEVAPRTEPAFLLAVDDEHGLAGVAIGERWEGGVGYVAQLAVASRARGRGHGRALLLALIDAFREAGLSTAELSVAGTNMPATGLYESAGLSLDFRAERWELSRSSA
jgi:mycothiol synthase